MPDEVPSDKQVLAAVLLMLTQEEIHPVFSHSLDVPDPEVEEGKHIPSSGWLFEVGQTLLPGSVEKDYGESAS